MIDKNQELEKLIFDKLIQSTVDIYTYDDNKGVVLLKSGKLLNFNIKIPFLYFMMEYKSKMRDFPIPQPFKFKWDGEKLVMSYELKDSVNNKKIVDRMVEIGKDSESKFFDKRIYIKPIT